MSSYKIFQFCSLVTKASFYNEFLVLQGLNQPWTELRHLESIKIIPESHTLFNTTRKYSNLDQKRSQTCKSMCTCGKVHNPVSSEQCTKKEQDCIREIHAFYHEFLQYMDDQAQSIHPQKIVNLIWHLCICNLIQTVCKIHIVQICVILFPQYKYVKLDCERDKYYHYFLL